MTPDRFDDYFSNMIGQSVDGNPDQAVQVFETSRRLQCEEGYGSVWPILILKKAASWWVSTAPGLKDEIEDAIQPFLAGDGFTPALIGALKNILSRQYAVKSHPHSQVFRPAMPVLEVQLPGECMLRLIRMDEKPQLVPEESVEWGTAFGVYHSGKLASWAEVTPLPSITPRFGVMLVGIETLPEYQRRGYARAVLAQATRRVLAIGNIPIYHCGVQNVASQRTALSCGYQLYGETLRFQV